MTLEVRPIRPGEGGALLAMVRALAESHGFLDKQTATADDALIRWAETGP